MIKNNAKASLVGTYLFLGKIVSSAWKRIIFQAEHRKGENYRTVLRVRAKGSDPQKEKNNLQEEKEPTAAATGTDQFICKLGNLALVGSVVA